MTNAPKLISIALLTAALAGCGGSEKQETTATPMADTMAAANSAMNAADTVTNTAGAAMADAKSAAPAAFGACAACHSVEAGKTLIGPSLHGVYGTKAGDVPGYQFSDALKASAVTWDDATLDKWIENPMKMVPGTKMTFAGLSDAAKRKEVVEYLKSLK